MEHTRAKRAMPGTTKRLGVLRTSATRGRARPARLAGSSVPAQCWVAIAALVVAMALTDACWAQKAVPEWGDMWQPQLPQQEKHPSLLYDETDRQRMAGRLTLEPWAGWWHSVQRNGPRTTAAVKWWLTGDEQAARAARQDLLDRPIWRQQPQGYLEPSSHSLAEYVVTYDVLAAWEGLSAEDHKTVRDRIAAEANYYYKVMDAVPGGANYGNQRTLGASAMGMAALALCERTSDAIGPSQWLARALHEIRRDENFWFFRPGGLFVEGLGYTNYMNVQFVPFAIAYERATGKYLFADPRLREWLVFACYQLTGHGESVMWGTSEAQVGLSYLSLLVNERYGRDLAPLFATAFSLPSSPRPHPHQIHMALAHYQDTVQGAAPPASRSFGPSQTAVMRDSWSRDTVSVWFAGKDGTWPLEYRYGTYSHGDSGHFVVSAWGEFLAVDSGYDHWKSRDYYAAEFHNVVLIDGKGPAQDTPGEMLSAQVAGPVQHATVRTAYQGCTVRRTVALVRGRYVLVADRVLAAGEHEYAWQIRSACPPHSPGTQLGERAVTWPGLSATGWRSLEPGRAQLTTVVPTFATLGLETGRWRPMSGKDEFTNQVAVARWKAGQTTALFALIPNLKESPDLSWRPVQGQDLDVEGPGWTDRVQVAPEGLSIRGDDGAIDVSLDL